MSLENFLAFFFFFFFFLRGGKMVLLLLQISLRLSLTAFKANDSVLIDTQKTSRLSPQLFTIRQSPDAPF